MEAAQKVAVGKATVVLGVAMQAGAQVVEGETTVEEVMAKEVTVVGEMGDDQEVEARVVVGRVVGAKGMVVVLVAQTEAAAAEKAAQTVGDMVAAGPEAAHAEAALLAAAVTEAGRVMGNVVE
eukprot:1810684-Prymnesium_polylepis.1